MVPSQDEEALVKTVRALPPDESETHLAWARALGELAGGHEIEWSDSWSDEHLADATAASRRLRRARARPGFRPVSVTQSRPTAVLSTKAYHQPRPDVVLGLNAMQAPTPLTLTHCEPRDWKKAALHAASYSGCIWLGGRGQSPGNPRLWNRIGTRYRDIRAGLAS